ncbi:serine protease inhibitor 77Ba-like [Leguminivora glycinivorella]|uniref:serine protease inhibitor 77Ba-like n=1 Tax=Leguminivora glycinivorella TaxID=1035111 RepID=UPI00200EDC55|nr:serine protease inhibitor 77Ba-like [Leguminivora glycinivorella]
MRFSVLIFLITSCYCDVDFSERPRNFSVELLYHTQKAIGGHVVISPFGIWTLMTGLAVGATGDSFEQIRIAFILPRSLKTVVAGYKGLTNSVLKRASDGVSLTSKNFVFADDDLFLKPGFKQTVTKDFDATIKVLDFKDSNDAAAKANNFILNSGARVTNVLFSEDFEQSRMILTNVISFKGLWTSPFNASDTTVEDFYNENKEVMGKVKMMQQKGEFPLTNIVALKSFVCELTYGTDEAYSMLVILPHPGVKVEDVYKILENITIPDIIARLQQDINDYGLDEVEIKLPRFKISTNIVMNRPLNDMGVYDIFDPAYASFSRATNESIYVSSIVHKADIEVSEAGTVASAVSAAVLSNRFGATRLVADRPFLYFIIERSTATVIFAGIYSKPSLY